MNLPPLFSDGPPSPDQPFPVPTEAECVSLWDTCDMMPHIRDHSRGVADMAVRIIRQASRPPASVPQGPSSAPSLSPALPPALPAEDEVLAAGLLHDLAKTYCIRHGGAHDQLGAAWVREATGNPALAQAVLFHVHWPWSEGPLSPQANPLRLPLIISYADKRIRHAEKVSLTERFDDLLARYGHTEAQCASIRRNLAQARALEKALISRIGDLD